LRTARRTALPARRAVLRFALFTRRTVERTRRRPPRVVAAPRTALRRTARLAAALRTTLRRTARRATVRFAALRAAFFFLVVRRAFFLAAM
jgi:hypothetical protein